MAKQNPLPRGITFQSYRGEEVKRFALCPTHGHKTSNEQGVGQRESGARYVLFRCPAKADHMSHIFAAVWPSNTPEKVAQVEKWKEKERADELKEMNKDGL